MRSSALYPDWDALNVELPDWVVRHGLRKCNKLVGQVYASAKIWQQAKEDGIANVAPIIVKFNKSPQEIRQEIGGLYWKQIHHATTKANVDRLVLMVIGGWTLDEAMLFPIKGKTSAKMYIGNYGKTALLHACRLSAKGGDFRDQLTIAQDVQRMGGVIDPCWGRKRLKKEHDALVVKRMFDRTDSTPWAKSWFFDVGAYSFALLKSETDLAIEGATQRHCIASYASACRSGRETALRIDGAEHATCSWKKGDSQIQVKGFANSQVSAECIAAAKEARVAYLATIQQEKSQ